MRKLISILGFILVFISIITIIYLSEIVGWTMPSLTERELFLMYWKEYVVSIIILFFGIVLIFNEEYL